MAYQTVSDGELLKAHVLNQWSRAAMQYYGFAFGERRGFNTLRQTYGENNDGTEVLIWDGYLLYTGVDDLHAVYYATAANGVEQAVVRILLNGVEISSTNSGSDGTDIDRTIDISMQNLTAWQVYPLQVKAYRSGTSQTVSLTVNLKWLALEKTYNYVSIPAFGNAIWAATYLNRIPAALDQLADAVLCPLPPTAFDYQSYHLDNDNYYPVWRGWFKHAHETLHVRLRSTTSSAGDGNWRLMINGTESRSGGLSTDNSVYEFDEDISANGIAKGELYQVEIMVNRTGTSNSIDVSVTVEDVYEKPPAATDAPTGIFSHGDTISGADMTRFKTIIEAIHPDAPAPTAPIFYAMPAVRKSTYNRYRLRHIAQFLFWKNDGSGTTEIELANGEKIALGTDGGTADLIQYGQLTLGTYYTIDDCEMAAEAHTK